jgi:formylglycine-generating enzyme required for sulfatase activity
MAQSNTRPCIKPGSGESFKDCPECPEMVIVPSGSFIMGPPNREPECKQNEFPQHTVTIAEPFAVGKFAVTFAEWDACVADGGCNGYHADDNLWGRKDRPVINVSWSEAKAYVLWLSNKTKASYSLLSEAEREYVTRAGTTTPFSWGSSISTEQANFLGSTVAYKGGGSKGEYRGKTMPVQSFKPNPWGLYQVHGNIWEWVEDCGHDNYFGAPDDGSAWITGNCRNGYVIRGGSWMDFPAFLRSASRKWTNSARSSFVGFRVARMITP